MKTLKRLLIASLVLPLLLLGAVIVFVFTLDPNRLKPLIVKAAQEQNVALTFKGDLSWQLLPTLGVTLGQLELKTLGGTPLLDIGNASLNVQLKPLLQRQIEVSGLKLENSTAYYTVDAQGTNNWAEVAPNQTEAAPADTSANTAALDKIAIDQIKLQNLAAVYKDETTGQQARVNNINLQINGLAFDGTAFPVQLSLLAELENFAPVELAFSGPIGLNLDGKALDITAGALQINSGQAQANLTVNTKTHWANSPTSVGKITLAPTSAKAWLNAFNIEPPQTQNPDALTAVALTTDFNIQETSALFENLKLTLDKTQFTGFFKIDEFTQPKIVTSINGTQINLDDYLPPATESTEVTAAAPTPLPLEPLRNNQVDATFKMQSLTTQKLTFSNTNLVLKNNRGLVTLNTLNTQVAEGEINAKGELDGRADDANLNLAITSSGVDAGQLLSTFADVDNIKGLMFAEATVKSHGSTDQALKDNLLVNATANSKALQLVPINLEKAYCQAVSLLQKQAMPAFDWPQLTQLEPVTLNIELKGSQLSIQNLNAQIAKLVGNAQGSFNTTTGAFNIPFTLSLGSLGADIEGCLPIPEKWRTRQLHIRCKGNLSDIGAKTCLPDTKLVEDQLKDKAQEKLDAEKARAKEKLEAEQDRTEDKLKEKAQELLDKNVKEEDKEAVEGAIKDLLKGLKKK